MSDIVGVRFKRAGKVYYFDGQGFELKQDESVVVETARGQEIGQIVIPTKQVTIDEVANPLKPILRKATEEDLSKSKEYEAREKEAVAECARLIARLNLPMKPLSAEYNLDASRLTFYFSAEERIDFRDLVRELAKKLKVRVELRQTGPRDEAKLVGGCGRCGRPLCCASFLSEFAPVSIKMAKAQNLPLNPMKISGVCGRLMCCLVYEHEQYEKMKARLPRVGAKINTKTGRAKVISTFPLKETVLVEYEESQATAELSPSEFTIEGGDNRPVQPVQDDSK